MLTELDRLRLPFNQSQKLVSLYLPTAPFREHAPATTLRPSDFVYGAQSFMRIVRCKQALGKHLAQSGNPEESVGFALSTVIAEYTKHFGIPWQDFINNPFFPLGYEAYVYMYGKEDDTMDNADFRVFVRDNRPTFEQFMELVTTAKGTKRHDMTSDYFFRVNVPDNLSKLVNDGICTPNRAQELNSRLQSAHQLWLAAEYDGIMNPHADLASAIQRIFDTSIAQGLALADFFVPTAYSGKLDQTSIPYIAATSVIAVMVDELLDVGTDMRFGVCSTPIAAAYQSGEIEKLKNAVKADPNYCLSTVKHKKDYPATVATINELLGIALGQLTKLNPKQAASLRVLATVYPLVTQLPKMRTVLPVVSENVVRGV